MDLILSEAFLELLVAHMAYVSIPLECFFFFQIKMQSIVHW